MEQVDKRKKKKKGWSQGGKVSRFLKSQRNSVILSKIGGELVEIIPDENQATRTRSLAEGQDKSVQKKNHVTNKALRLL